MKKDKYLILGISSFSGASMAAYLIKRNKSVYGSYRNNKVKPYLPFNLASKKSVDRQWLCNVVSTVHPGYLE